MTELQIKALTFANAVVSSEKNSNLTLEEKLELFNKAYKLCLNLSKFEQSN